MSDFQLMSEIVLRQLDLAKALLKPDVDQQLILEVERNELLIDSMDIKIRESVINAILLFSPRASDLRKIIAYHDMTIYLERIGDQMLNVAHLLKNIRLDLPNFVEFEKVLSKMMKQADKMVRNAVIAFSCQDSSVARKTIATDNDVDELLVETIGMLHSSFEGKTLDRQDLVNITGINSIASNIERMADNATNIAEAAIYLLEGLDIRHGNSN